MMKRSALGPAFLSVALLAACGVGDAARWIVDTSLRSASGNAPTISSSQSAGNASDEAKRPEPLRVSDRAIVAARNPEAEAARAVATSHRPRREEAVEIAAVPISRDLSSIRGKGTRSEHSFYRYASARDGRFYIHVRKPETPARPAATTTCPNTKGYRG